MAIGKPSTTKVQGKMNAIRGNRSFTGASIASFSARAKRSPAVARLRAQDGTEVHAQGLGLDQCRHEVGDGCLVHAIGQAAQGIHPRLAGAHIAQHPRQLLAQRASRPLGYGLCQRATQIQPRLDAQGDDVQEERQRLQGVAAASLDLVAQPVERERIAARRREQGPPRHGQAEGAQQPAAKHGAGCGAQQGCSHELFGRHGVVQACQPQPSQQALPRAQRQHRAQVVRNPTHGPPRHAESRGRHVAPASVLWRNGANHVGQPPRQGRHGEAQSDGGGQGHPLQITHGRPLIHRCRRSCG